jgi:pyridinium-3,5-biscarboxylic acid mononucleotide sulfurtransferase
MVREPVPPTPRPVEALVARLAGGGPTLVALSGGVDSSAAASLAYRALGARALAATVVSRSVSAAEIAAARAAAAAIGIEHRFVEGEPLSDPRYRENGSDRCYRCRSIETAALVAVGRTLGIRQFLDGIHTDDLGDDRPGIRAMDEAGFLHPFLWAGWSKADVRQYARSVGLPNWDRPSNACLASRVARGEPITEELLDRIGRAETVLLDLGFRRVRVRSRAGVATVEVGSEETERLELPELRRSIGHALHVLGFASVVFDPVGYRSREPLPVVP